MPCLFIFIYLSPSSLECKLFERKEFVCLIQNCVHTWNVGAGRLRKASSCVKGTGFPSTGLQNLSGEEGHLYWVGGGGRERWLRTRGLIKQVNKNNENVTAGEGSYK